MTEATPQAPRAPFVSMPYVGAPNVTPIDVRTISSPEAEAIIRAMGALFAIAVQETGSWAFTDAVRETLQALHSAESGDRWALRNEAIETAYDGIAPWLAEHATPEQWLAVTASLRAPGSSFERRTSPLIWCADHFGFWIGTMFVGVELDGHLHT